MFASVFPPPGQFDLEITAGSRMRDAGIALAKAMKPGDVPQPPKHGPFTQPWSYGNVRPEVK